MSILYTNLAVCLTGTLTFSANIAHWILCLPRIKCLFPPPLSNTCLSSGLSLNHNFSKNHSSSFCLNYKIFRKETWTEWQLWLSIVLGILHVNSFGSHNTLLIHNQINITIYCIFNLFIYVLLSCFVPLILIIGEIVIAHSYFKVEGFPLAQSFPNIKCSSRII